ncbi:amphoterin-induced protein 3 [Polypterus senegalus]
MWAAESTLTLLGTLLLQLPAKASASEYHSCNASCICASDILSCVNKSLYQVPTNLPTSTTALDLSHNMIVQLKNRSFWKLSRLEMLRLAHNRLTDISQGAFLNASGVRHLDLSSNRLQVVEQHYFQELCNLEELLLYNNHISRVDNKALSSLTKLHKAYFSWNLLTDFPFFSIQQESHPLLTTLDISSNRLLALPIEEVAALPVSIKNGLFLHNNPLRCECTLYSMFHHWEREGFSSVHDFREEHTCLAYGQTRAQIRFFHHVRIFENCTFYVPGMPNTSQGNLQAYVGEPLHINCGTILHGAHTTYHWISPHREFIIPPSNTNKTIYMYTNGSLEIKEAQIEDSGIYICVAINRGLMRNETREVNVTVLKRRSHGEGFNTALTTLLGCVVTLVLVVMYLYLTPCYCCCRKQPSASPTNECSAQSSILTSTPPASTEGPGRKISGNKHVVFLEPIKEVQNGRLKMMLGSDNSQQMQHFKSDSDSITSLYSDSPMVL